MELNGKLALITGAGRRLGRAIAEHLAQQGIRVVIHYHHSQQQAQEVATAIQQQGGWAEILSTNLEHLSSVATLIDQVYDRFAPVDILVNNAANFAPGTTTDTPLSVWQQTLDLNLTAPFLLMQRFAQHLPAGSQGRIVNILDRRVLRLSPGRTAYTVAKSGLWTLTQLAAMEWAPHITVNAIAPGPILAALGDPPSHLLNIARQTPMQKPGSPLDIASTALFLIQHNYITGEMIAVDGGAHL